MTRQTTRRKSTRARAARPSAAAPTARDVVRAGLGAVAALSARAQATLAPLRAHVEAFARDAEREFETRVLPVLAKFGVAAAPKRRAARKARTTGSRKPAARRVRKA